MNEFDFQSIGRREVEQVLAGNSAELERELKDALPFASAEGLIPAAVMCLLRPDRDYRVILTRRAENLPQHAGQISFPGGRIEPDDRSPLDAALREAREEIGLDPKAVSIAGALKPNRTGTGYLIVPFVGFVPAGFSPVADRREVAEVFEAPLCFLLDPRNRRRKRARIDGVDRQYYVVTFGEYEIWGATAAILKSFSDCFRPDFPESGPE